MPRLVQRMPGLVQLKAQTGPAIHVAVQLSTDESNWPVDTSNWPPTGPTGLGQIQLAVYRFN